MFVTIGELVDERMLGVYQEIACGRIIPESRGVRAILHELGLIERLLCDFTLICYQPLGLIFFFYLLRDADIERIRTNLHRIANAAE